MMRGQGLRDILNFLTIAYASTDPDFAGLGYGEGQNGWFRINNFCAAIRTGTRARV